MVSGSIAQAPPSEPIGTRDIDSTPPANTRSSQPEATFWAAMLTASRPEAQKRLSWTPETVSGRPALIAAALAMSPPWSPIGDTQPSTTSSTRLGSRSALRLSISCIRPTTRSIGLVVCSDPLTLPFPRGVRIASKTSGSVAGISAPCVLAHTMFGKSDPMLAVDCRWYAAGPASGPIATSFLGRAAGLSCAIGDRRRYPDRLHRGGGRGRELAAAGRAHRVGAEPRGSAPGLPAHRRRSAAILLGAALGPWSG